MLVLTRQSNGGNSMPRKSRKLKVGDRAPSFSLEDAVSGGTFTLKELLGQPLVVIFFRGTW